MGGRRTRNGKTPRFRLILDHFASSWYHKKAEIAENNLSMLSLGTSKRIKSQISPKILVRVRIFELWLANVRVTDIVKDAQVNLNKRQVQYWVRRFREHHGQVPVEELFLDRPRSGRPTKRTEAVKKLIRKRVESHHHRSVRKTSAYLRGRG